MTTLTSHKDVSGLYPGAVLSRSGTALSKSQKHNKKLEACREDFFCWQVGFMN